MMKARDRYVFLLGGQDLEMIEIRKMIGDQGYREGEDFFDKKLAWGASLSAYQECFNPDDQFVGIELIEDIEPPDRYIRIDHHNELAHLPSSMEQVAALLGVSLSRKQQLIAANDKGYIPAMLAMGASQDEVDTIRRMDRAAQGATEEDERLAIASIEAARQHGDITLVNSLTKKFSTITDRLYGKADRLLIYTDEEFTYYGTESDKELLISLFADQIAAGKMYYGGQAGGFIGAGAGKYSPQNLSLLRNTLVNSLNIP